MAIINTCKDCDERHLKCHVTCQKYIDAKAAHDAAMKRKREMEGVELHEHKVDSIAKRRRRLHR